MYLGIECKKWCYRKPAALPGLNTELASLTYSPSLLSKHISARDCEQMPSISFQLILDAALADYRNQVGTDLATHPLANNLRSCGNTDDVLKLIEDKANEFKEFRDGNRKLLNWLRPIVQVVHTLSAVLGASITLVSQNILVRTIYLFFTNSVRSRSGQQRRSLLAWMFSSQYVSNHLLGLRHLIISGYCRQPVASARATMHSSTCLNVSEIS